MGTQPGGQSRRTVLKALGAGTALSALGVTVVGGQEDDGDDDGGSGGRTVHRVQTLIAPSTNADRPADFYFQPTGLHVAPGDVLAFEFVTPDHNVVAYHPAFGMRRRVPLGVEAFSSPLKGWKPSSIPGDMVEPPMPAAAEEPSEGDGGTGDGEGNDTEVAANDSEGNDTEVAVNDTAVDVNQTEGDGDGDAGGQAGPVPDQFLLSLATSGVYDLLCSPHEHFGMAMRVVVGDETEAPFETESAEELPPPRAGPVELSREVLTDPALAPERIVEQGTVSWADLDANQVSDPEGDGDEGGGAGDDDTDGDQGDDGSDG